MDSRWHEIIKIPGLNLFARTSIIHTPVVWLAAAAPGVTH